MGQLTKEETKTVTRKLPEGRLERDQQCLSGEENNSSEEEEQTKDYKAKTPLTVDPVSDDFERCFLEKCSMKTVELASSGEESDSEEETDDNGEKLKRGPTNGVPVNHLKSPEIYFTSSLDQFNGNNSKRTSDYFEDPCHKYRRPVPSNKLTDPWLSSSFPMMNGGTVSVSSGNYESDYSQSTFYPWSDASRSPDQNDNQNDLVSSNQANTLDDLMVILEEDRNKTMYSNKEDLISSSKDSHIRTIKETLKNGFDVSSNNIPETFNFDYQDIKSKAASPPQCVPQLDQPYHNLEITEPQNIIITEEENLNQIAAMYDQRPALKNYGQISVNKNIHEQVLLNSSKQNGTADGCSIINTPQYLRQQYVDNLISICNQGQIAMNESNQSRPVRNSGNERQVVMDIGQDKRTTIVGSGTQLQGLHNYGDQKQMRINESAGQRLARVGPGCHGLDVMNTRNASLTMISAGNQGRIMMNPTNENQVIINTGIPNQAIMNAGSPGQIIANAGSPGQIIANAGSPGQIIANAGSPGHSISNAGSPGQPIMSAGSPGQTIINAGSPGQTLIKSESPGQTLVNAGSPHQNIINAGSPHQNIINAGSPHQNIINAGSPHQNIINAGSPHQNILTAGSPHQSIMNAGSPHQNIVNVSSPNQTILNADSPSQTILDEDEQDLIIKNATSQAQTVNRRQNWMNSLDERQNLPPVSVACTVNPNKSPLIYSPVAEIVGHGSHVYSPQSHGIINGTTPNLQNTTQAIHNQTTTPGTLTSPAVSSTPLYIMSHPPPLYIMSPTTNALILVQKPPTPTTKSLPKPILPKPPASDIKPAVSEEHIFPKHFSMKKGKANFATDTNALKPGASHQIIARRCVASRTDDELLAIDSEGNNYLHAAVCVTDVNMVKALLERIKRIKKIEIINNSNSFNQTPLYLAVSNNKPAVVCELVRNGANPNIPAEKRRSVLHCAATQGKEFSLTLKQLFESKKIDPNIKNSDGLTPLLCAIMEHGKIVSRNNKNIMIDNCVNVSLLLKNGADPELYDGRNGMTPLMHAIERKDINLVEAIAKHVDPARFQKLLLAKTFSERTCSMIAEELQNKYDPSVYRKLTSILSLNK